MIVVRNIQLRKTIEITRIMEEGGRQETKFGHLAKIEFAQKWK
jgi:hypothetical protein